MHRRVHIHEDRAQEVGQDDCEKLIMTYKEKKTRIKM
jgi:hypothetical protein